ncbi:MAG: bifunctional phosphopantothenoylcysteine decarboxylase/phosphopantothenate--cysteine ligase CoaBC, partial [Fibrobacteraceae bacterium]
MRRIHRAAVIIYILRMRLSGKKILLGVTGGIAAYKSCELLRLLQKEGAEVRVAMTPAATTFVGPLTFASLSRYPVFLKSGALDAGPFQHIEYPRWADLYLVVPCSANTLARFAAGLADEPVSLCFLARTVPAWVAPAMNFAMYLSPAVQANIALLKSRGVKILQAPAGELACGESGPGRCPEPADILRALIAADEPVPESSPFCAPPNGKRVLITAGRTEEQIDPVRYISNRSSGKTGAALADAFARAGYAVTVIAGPMEATLPAGVERVSVKSASEMHGAVLERMNAF